MTTIAADQICIDKVLPNPMQPRQTFDLDELESLAASIRENGVITPIVVEEAQDGFYILHDGERRLRASKLAQLLTIPASIVPALNGSGNRERLVRALVANVQRADLNPIEEGRAYNELRKQGETIDGIARKLGVSYTRVENYLDLLNLDIEIQELIGAKKLSKDARLTRALLDIPDVMARVQLAQALASRAASVKTCLFAAKKLAEQLATPVIAPTDIPALDIAQRESKFARPQWDALAQVGRLPPWEKVIESARQTCDGCSLRSMASQKTCQECPAVELIRRMIEDHSHDKRMKKRAHA